MDKKKLIFCFDGTTNELESVENFAKDGSITNIVKLHAFFGGRLDLSNKINEKCPNQHSFYYSGVGTRGNFLSRIWNSIFAPENGDMESIVKEAFSDLKEHCGSSAEIYIFGFSRGAAIARIFASKCEKPVKFLGVFDTVAATKGSFDMNPNTFPDDVILFENGTVGDHVEKAIHLIALDEERIIFQPTLFNKNNKVQEIWFSGVHTDIGGGFWFDGLSDITLQFMLDQVKEELTILGIDDIAYKLPNLNNSEKSICKDDLFIKRLSGGVLHKQERKWLYAKKTLRSRVVRTNKDDNICLEESPIIHYTVKERFNKITAYRPISLRDKKFRVLEKDGSITGPYQGVNNLSLN